MHIAKTGDQPSSKRANTMSPDTYAGLALIVVALFVVAMTPPETRRRQWRALTRGRAE